MTKRIFRSFLISMVVVLAAAIALIAVSMNHYFITSERSVLHAQADLAAAGIQSSGINYFKGLSRSDTYRLTWVSEDGTVLCDNWEDASEMENHSQREEIREALENGSGESERYSATMAERTMYYAEKMKDGTVIRIAITHDTLWAMLAKMAAALVWILMLAIASSILIARFVAKRIAGPLNALDLDHPLENNGYPELKPLLMRIDNQNHQIDAQMKELKKRENEFALLSDSISEGLILTDQKGNLLQVNPAGRALLGMNESENIDPRINDIIRKALEGKRSQGVITREERSISIEAEPVFSNGRQTGAAVVAADITQQYEAESMRREFTANVSHELKTPLQTIMGSAELLENHLVKKEDENDFLHKIRTESARLLTLIDDIIRLSQLDEDTKLEEEDLNLADLAAEACNALSDSAAQHHVQIIQDLQPAVIHANARLVYEIFYNLTDNALRYNKENGTVTIHTGIEKGRPMLYVKDSGIGIPASSLPRIFERFYRVDKSHSRATGGTGLGLSIVKHAVIRCHGIIRVESTVGKGSQFTVSF